MRFVTSVTAVSLCLVGLAAAAEVHAAIRRATNIPAEGLAAALKALAQDRDFQLIYRSALVGDLQTGGAAGELTADEALAELLRGTGLTYRHVGETAVIIVPKGQAARSAEGKPDDFQVQGAQKSDFWERFRVAQVDQGAPTSASPVEKEDRQNSDQNPMKLEEVIVTAQKRTERLIDVPISIVALSSDELAQRQIRSLDDLPSAVPGLSIQTNGEQRKIVLRGISNSGGSNAALIGMYFDETDVTLAGYYQVSPDTYDLERIEVLRGPQGTLYGEGSAGGTIRFITKNPNLRDFSMTADVSASFTERGAPSQRVSSMVNVPLISGQLGLRLVGTFDHEGGWIDQPAAGLKDINGQNLTDVRIKGFWQPSDHLTVSAMAKLYRNDRSSDTGEDDNGNFTQVANLTATPKIEDDHDLYNLTLAYDFAAARLLNSASYFRAFDGARNLGFLYPFNPPAYYFAPVILTNDHVLQDELRLTSIAPGPWQWTVGAFYRHFRDSSLTPTAYFDTQGPPGTPLPASIEYDTWDLFKDWSIFGDVSYTFANRVTVGAGVRYFRDKQDYSTLASGFETSQEGTFHSVDPRFYAQYKLTSDSSLYTSAAKGFRTGGFNAGGQPTYDPESVWTYELGSKTLFMEGRFSLDAAIFYSNYSKYQTTGVAPPPNTILQSITSNAGDAKIKGVEGDFSWHPTYEWTLSVNGDYLHTRFTRINATKTNYIVGDGLDFVPKYQYSVSGQRNFTVSDKTGSVRLDYSEQGRETYRQRSINQYYFNESNVVRLLNLYTSLTVNKELTLGFFVQNLLNDREFLSPRNIELNAARSRPRTYGIEFNVALD